MRTDTRANGMRPAAARGARPGLAALAPRAAGNAISILPTPLPGAGTHMSGPTALTLIRLTLALTCPATRRAGSVAG